MPKLIGPLGLEQVAEMIRQVGESHFNDYRRSARLRTEIHLWTPEDFERPNRVFNKYPTDPSEQEIRSLYVQAYESDRLGRFAERSGEIAVSVMMTMEGVNQGKTRIFNKTLMTDLLSGQIVPPTQNELIIYGIPPATTGCNSVGSLTKYQGFVAKMNAALREAQLRLSRFM